MSEREQHEHALTAERQKVTDANAAKLQAEQRAVIEKAIADEMREGQDIVRASLDEAESEREQHEHALTAERQRAREQHEQHEHALTAERQRAESERECASIEKARAEDVKEQLEMANIERFSAKEALTDMTTRKVAVMNMLQKERSELHDSNIKRFRLSKEKDQAITEKDQAIDTMELTLAKKQDTIDELQEALIQQPQQQAQQQQNTTLSPPPLMKPTLEQIKAHLTTAEYDNLMKSWGQPYNKYEFVNDVGDKYTPELMNHVDSRMSVSEEEYFTPILYSHLKAADKRAVEAGFMRPHAAQYMPLGYNANPLATPYFGPRTITFFHNVLSVQHLINKLKAEFYPGLNPDITKMGMSEMDHYLCKTARFHVQLAKQASEDPVEQYIAFIVLSQMSNLQLDFGDLNKVKLTELVASMEFRGLDKFLEGCRGVTELSPVIDGIDGWVPTPYSHGLVCANAKMWFREQLDKMKQLSTTSKNISIAERSVYLLSHGIGNGRKIPIERLLFDLSDDSSSNGDDTRAGGKRKFDGDDDNERDKRPRLDSSSSSQLTDPNANRAFNLPRQQNLQMQRRPMLWMDPSHDYLHLPSALVLSGKIIPGHTWTYTMAARLRARKLERTVLQSFLTAESIENILPPRLTVQDNDLTDGKNITIGGGNNGSGTYQYGRYINICDEAKEEYDRISPLCLDVESLKVIDNINRNELELLRLLLTIIYYSCWSCPRDIEEFTREDNPRHVPGNQFDKELFEPTYFLRVMKEKTNAKKGEKFRRVGLTKMTVSKVITEVREKLSSRQRSRFNKEIRRLTALRQRQNNDDDNSESQNDDSDEGQNQHHDDDDDDDDVSELTESQYQHGFGC